MDNIIETITTLIDYIIEDEDRYSDEEIYQLAVRLENLKDDCLNSINYDTE